MSVVIRLLLLVLVPVVGFLSHAQAQNKVDVTKDIAFAAAVRVDDVKRTELKKQGYVVTLRVINSGQSERPYNIIVSLSSEKTDTHYVLDVGLSTIAVAQSKAVWVNARGSNAGVYVMIDGMRDIRAARRTENLRYELKLTDSTGVPLDAMQVNQTVVPPTVAGVPPR